VRHGLGLLAGLDHPGPTDPRRRSTQPRPLETHRYTDDDQVDALDLPAGSLDGAVVQVGKRRFKRFRTP